MNLPRTKKPKKWTKLHARVAEWTDHLAIRYGGPGPAVALRDIANQCHIRKVEFQPLLVDGGLSFGQAVDGFVVHVRCDRDRATEYHNRFVESGGRDLPRRMRFTIAHEIAHTYFFDLSDGKPRHTLKASDRAELDNLERACDHGANRLLLPGYVVRQLVESENMLHPRSLLDFAEKTAVSVETLVIRLSHEGDWRGSRGAAGVVVSEHGQPKIRAVAFDSLSRSLFPDAAPGASARTLLFSERLKLFGGTESKVTTVIRCRLGSKAAEHECVAACEAVSREPMRYLFTVRLADRPRLIQDLR